jgi:hypothetical protein
MTKQQQNILELFNSADPVNKELAKQIAISSGNEVWFREEILDKIALIKKIINSYCKTYIDDNDDSLCFDECAELIYLQVLFKGIQMKALYDKDGDFTRYEIWADDIIIYGNTYTISFDCDENHEYALKEELEELGIKVTIH